MTAKRGPTLEAFVQQRGVVQELSPALAAAAIQGYRDEISAAAKADEAFYRQFRCPTCRSTMMQQFIGGPQGSGTTWLPNEVTPQAVLRCTQCHLLLNPRSGIIIERGHEPFMIPVDDDVSGLRRSS